MTPLLRARQNRLAASMLGLRVRMWGDRLLPNLVNVGEKDLLMPPGTHQATISEVTSHLVETSPKYQRRVELWRLYVQFRTLLRGLVTVDHEFIDGSFVTSRPAPKDIDASFWISAKNLQNLDLARQQAFASIWNVRLTQFRVDGYLVTPCPPKHQRHADFVFWKTKTEESWPAYKNRAREMVPGVTKGYIEVLP